MSTGRRGLLLSAVFLGLALWIVPAERARAQPPFRQGRPVEQDAGRHTIWKRELSPEQIRELLARFGQGDKEGDNFLENAIRDRIKNNQKEPLTKEQQERMDATIKKMLADKDFMDWALDQAQKHKNQNPDGKFEITPEMIENLKKRRQADPNAPNNGKGGDPFVLPKFDPKQLPFDPNNPGKFDPKQFPNIDPETGFPRDPRTGRPFDPNTGKPIDPKNPPKINPPDPKVNPADPKVNPKEQPPPPPPPPAIDPKTGRPVDPQGADPNRKFDPNNPLGPNDESPEKAAKTKAVETATALWEKNVGPIDESPAVKRAILDLVTDPEAMDALSDGKGNNFFDLFNNKGDNGDGMKDLFGDGKGWEWPKLDFNFNWGKSNRDIDIPETPRPNRWPNLSSSDRRRGSSDGMGSFDLAGLRVPVLLVLIFFAMLLALLLWWKWSAIFPSSGQAGLAGAAGVGPWPIDPRTINTREDIVKAFEYLSVLICGAGAKTWTHSTIADELTALAASNGETAMKLARLYELARYAPLDEPLTRAEIIEARRLACDLAGVDEA